MSALFLMEPRMWRRLDEIKAKFAKKAENEEILTKNSPRSGEKHN